MSIVKGSNQVETQAEPLAPVAVRASQDAKPLEPADDVFGHNPLLGQLPVGLLLGGRERMMLAPLTWRATVAMCCYDDLSLKTWRFEVIQALTAPGSAPGSAALTVREACAARGVSESGF